MQPIVTPQDNPAQHRIEVDLDGAIAFADYAFDGDVIVFVHTFVPEALRGHGIATRLVVAGLEMARSRKLKVIPDCPMVAAYMKKHPETHDLLAPAGRVAMDA